MIPGVDSWAVAVALSLDSLWSSWILFGGSPDDLRGLALDDPGVNGCGFSSCERLRRCRGGGLALAGFCLEFVGVVALSLDSLWSSWPWIPFGLALDDPGVNGCGGAVVVGFLLLDSVWRFA